MTTSGTPDLRAKYRPVQFRHVAQGLHEPAVRLTTMMIAQRRRLQAVLYRARYGHGKTTLARLVGMRACCLQQDLHPFEPCGGCDGCRAVLSDPHDSSWYGYNELDVQRLSPREVYACLMHVIPFRKNGGTLMSQRVVTLDEFHRLAVRDQEKFVKIIEDLSTRYRTLFILCAAPEAKICEAIEQRCAVRNLRPPSLPRAVRHLRVMARSEGVHLSAENAELIAASTDCGPRNYVDLLQDVLMLADGSHHIDRSTIETVLDSVRQGKEGPP